MSGYPVSFNSDSVAYDQLIAGNSHDLISRQVTIPSGEVLTRGSVLGKITADGNYTLSLSAAGDGSEDPDAVLAEDADASGGDVGAMAYFRGDFVASQLTIGTGHTVETVTDAFRPKGIAVIDAEPANT